MKNVQSHISQTVMLLAYTKELGFRDDSSTGKVTLFVENQIVDAEGNISIKNALIKTTRLVGYTFMLHLWLISRWLKMCGIT
jgi:hypothetical protein